MKPGAYVSMNGEWVLLEPSLNMKLQLAKKQLPPKHKEAMTPRFIKGVFADQGKQYLIYYDTMYEVYRIKPTENFHEILEVPDESYKVPEPPPPIFIDADFSSGPTQSILGGRAKKSRRKRRDAIKRKARTRRKRL